jgi:hypothetical protein
MAWWAWLILGLVFLVGEMLTPGMFFLLFFGISSLFVALTTLIGVTEGAGTQWSTAAAVAVFSLIFIRRKFIRKAEIKDMDKDSLIGGEVIVKEVIAPGNHGNVEYRGSTWKALNSGNTILEVGARSTIKECQGLTLIV